MFLRLVVDVALISFLLNNYYVRCQTTPSPDDGVGVRRLKKQSQDDVLADRDEHLRDYLNYHENPAYQHETNWCPSKCNNPSHVYEDPNLSEYCTCNENGTTERHTCPDSHIYNSTLKSCHPLLGNGRPTCVIKNQNCPDNRLGIEKHPNQDLYQSYIICQNGTVIVAKCNEGDYYNEEKKCCDKEPQRNTILSHTDCPEAADIKCEARGVFPMDDYIPYEETDNCPANCYVICSAVNITAWNLLVVCQGGEQLHRYFVEPNDFTQEEVVLKDSENLIVYNDIESARINESELHHYHKGKRIHLQPGVVVNQFPSEQFSAEMMINEDVNQMENENDLIPPSFNGHSIIINGSSETKHFNGKEETHMLQDTSNTLSETLVIPGDTLHVSSEFTSEIPEVIGTVNKMSTSSLAASGDSLFGSTPKRLIEDVNQIDLQTVEDAYPLDAMASTFQYTVVKTTTSSDMKSTEFKPIEDTTSLDAVASTFEYNFARTTPSSTDDHGGVTFEAVRENKDAVTHLIPDDMAKSTRFVEGIKSTEVKPVEDTSSLDAVESTFEYNVARTTPPYALDSTDDHGGVTFIPVRENKDTVTHLIPEDITTSVRFVEDIKSTELKPVEDTSSLDDAASTFEYNLARTTPLYAEESNHDQGGVTFIPVRENKDAVTHLIPEDMAKSTRIVEDSKSTEVKPVEDTSSLEAMASTFEYNLARITPSYTEDSSDDHGGVTFVPVRENKDAVTHLVSDDITKSIRFIEDIQSTELKPVEDTFSLDAMASTLEYNLARTTPSYATYSSDNHGGVTFVPVRENKDAVTHLIPEDMAKSTRFVEDIKSAELKPVQDTSSLDDVASTFEYNLARTTPLYAEESTHDQEGVTFIPVRENKDAVTHLVPEDMIKSTRFVDEIKSTELKPVEDTSSLDAVERTSEYNLARTTPSYAEDISDDHGGVTFEPVRENKDAVTHLVPEDMAKSTRFVEDIKSTELKPVDDTSSVDTVESTSEFNLAGTTPAYAEDISDDHGGVTFEPVRENKDAVTHLVPEDMTKSPRFVDEIKSTELKPVDDTSSVDTVESTSEFNLAGTTPSYATDSTDDHGGVTFVPVRENKDAVTHLVPEDMTKSPKFVDEIKSTELKPVEDTSSLDAVERTSEYNLARTTPSYAEDISDDYGGVTFEPVRENKDAVTHLVPEDMTKSSRFVDEIKSTELKPVEDTSSLDAVERTSEYNLARTTPSYAEDISDDYGGVTFEPVRENKDAVTHLVPEDMTKSPRFVDEIKSTELKPVDDTSSVDAVESISEFNLAGTTPSYATDSTDDHGGVTFVPVRENKDAVTHLVPEDMAKSTRFVEDIKSTELKPVEDTSSLDAVERTTKYNLARTTPSYAKDISDDHGGVTFEPVRENKDAVTHLVPEDMTKSPRFVDEIKSTELKPVQDTSSVDAVESTSEFNLAGTTPSYATGSTDDHGDVTFVPVRENKDAVTHLIPEDMTKSTRFVEDTKSAKLKPVEDTSSLDSVLSSNGHGGVTFEPVRENKDASTSLISDNIGISKAPSYKDPQETMSIHKEDETKTNSQNTRYSTSENQTKISTGHSTIAASGDSLAQSKEAVVNDSETNEAAQHRTNPSEEPIYAKPEATPALDNSGYAGVYSSKHYSDSPMDNVKYLTGKTTFNDANILQHNSNSHSHHSSASGGSVMEAHYPANPWKSIKYIQYSDMEMVGGIDMHVENWKHAHKKCAVYKDRPCVSEGFFRYGNSCKLHYECHYDAACGSYIASPWPYRCPHCLQFNSLKQRCDLPANVPECTYHEEPEQNIRGHSTTVPLNMCTAPGVYKDPGNPRRYFQCVEMFDDGKFYLTLVKCPQGQVFDSRKGVCVEIMGKVKMSRRVLDAGGNHTIGSYIFDKYSCWRFFFYTPYTIVELHCPAGYVFNGKICEDLRTSVMCNWEELKKHLYKRIQLL